MTPSEAIAKADRNRPNMMAEQDKYDLLNEIEGRVYYEILMKHEHDAELEKPHYAPAEEVDNNEEPEEEPEMLVPDEYAKLYVYWMYCAIDELNKEFDLYNSDRALFEDAWGNFGDYWTREHMPLTASPSFRI